MPNHLGRGGKGLVGGGPGHGGSCGVEGTVLWKMCLVDMTVGFKFGARIVEIDPVTNQKN